MEDKGGILAQEKFVSQSWTNTKSDLIEITEDKLENILIKHLHKLDKAKGWLTPLSLFVTILIVLLSTEFKQFLSIEKEVWEAIFVIGSFATLIWTFYSGYQAYNCSKNTSIRFLIEQIKNSQNS